MGANVYSESRCSFASLSRSHNVLLCLQPIFNIKAVNVPPGFVELIGPSSDFLLQGCCVSSSHFSSEGWILRLHSFSSIVEAMGSKRQDCRPVAVAIVDFLAKIPPVMQKAQGKMPPGWSVSKTGSNAQSQKDLVFE